MWRKTQHTQKWATVQTHNDPPTILGIIINHKNPYAACYRQLCGKYPPQWPACGGCFMVQPHGQNDKKRVLNRFNYCVVVVVERYTILCAWLTLDRWSISALVRRDMTEIWEKQQEKQRARGLVKQRLRNEYQGMRHNGKTAWWISASCLSYISKTVDMSLKWTLLLVM